MRLIEKVLRNWRVMGGDSHGVYVWFDPAIETVRLYRLPVVEELLRLGVDPELDEYRESAYRRDASVSAVNEVDEAASNEIDEAQLGLELGPSL